MTTTRRPVAACLSAAMLGAALFAPLAALSGCELAGYVAANEERYGSKKVPPVYTGLQGHTYAVVIQADRSTLAENPNLMEHLLANINNRIAEHAGASGHIPSQQLILYMMNNARWSALSLEELAEELGGVERLIVVDLYEYRLHEPGNRYTWDGAAQARVIVFEADDQGGATALERDIRVTYPDDAGLTPGEIQREVITSVLARRVIDRVSWLFYEHEEANAITY
ncbi:MAG: hypothetical protein R3B68_03825 [Phycisphaerales bacterium]